MPRSNVNTPIETNRRHPCIGNKNICPVSFGSFQIRTAFVEATAAARAAAAAAVQLLHQQLEGCKNWGSIYRFRSIYGQDMKYKH